MLKLRKQATKRDVLGFRLPMLTHEEPALDITDITVVDPDNTYYMRMGSSAMTGYHILEDHVLVIDHSLAPVPGCIVVFFHEGDFYVRAYCPEQGQLLLKANTKAETIVIAEDKWECWGCGNADPEPFVTAGAKDREVRPCLRMLISITVMSAARRCSTRR